MPDDWGVDDPFVDPQDPAAQAREQRRREREERRRSREGKTKEKQASEPAAPSPPPEPPATATRTPEEEFWDEEPEVEPSPAAPPAPVPPRASRPPAPRPSHASRPPLAGAVLAFLRRHPLRIVAVIVALLALWFLNALFQPFHGDGSGSVSVTIPTGAGVGEVGDLLDEKGVIDSSTLFQLRVTLAGKRSEIYHGHYTLAHGMSYGAAIDALSTPPVKRTIAITIPEGDSRAQVAQLVEEAGVGGSYTQATLRSRYLDPARYGGGRGASLEGFLFPDTFELKPNAPVSDLVQLQLQDFKRRIGRVDMGYARSKNLTTFDVLTIASMIEDEAGVPSQRRLVASVIYNRLHEGMPLGIDATIRFATGNYDAPLTESQLATDSPYNTRTHAGLPPGPINSPGLAAIEAAAHPAKTHYLFYVTDPHGCNELTFASTEAEFEEDVEKYDSAREAAGGKAPSNCGE